MSANPTTSEATTATNGRAANGQFGKGNHFGTGNPFARQVAALRSALIETVTEQDIKEIAYILLLNAKAGDLASIKLLFQYVIGKPQPAVDPDTLDINEMKNLQQAALPAEVIDQMRGGAPLPFMLDVFRIQQEGKERQYAKMLQDELESPVASDEEDEDEPASAATDAARASQAMPTAAAAPPSPNGHYGAKGPSPNGANGAERPSPNGANGAERPSPNGANGDGGLAALMRWLGDRGAGSDDQYET